MSSTSFAESRSNLPSPHYNSNCININGVTCIAGGHEAIPVTSPDNNTATHGKQAATKKPIRLFNCVVPPG